MKRKLFVLIAFLAVFAGALGVNGCGRSARTKKPRPPVVAPAADPRPPLETDPEKITAQLVESVHAAKDCRDCHAPPKEGAKAGEVGKGQCTSCHEKEAKSYAETIHATKLEEGKEGAATCEDCHGVHDVRAGNDERSTVSTKNIPRTCGKCHENPELAKKLGIKQAQAVRSYVESIHGRNLVAGGLVVAPSCADCHGKAHHIFKATDPRSTVNEYNVVGTCGQCHTGARDAFKNGVHAKALEEQAQKLGAKVRYDKPATNGHAEAPLPKAAAPAAEDPKKKKAPTCPSCHSAHSIVERGAKFRLAEDKICGDCHEERTKRYHETYHGRAHDLGDTEVAACHDCHGAHDLWPSKEAASTLSSENRLTTCQKCHQGAPPSFAGFLPHADHGDKQHYPTLYWAYVGMTGLLVGTFGFFGIHSLLWLMRTLIVRFRDPAAFKAMKQRVRQEEGARLYRRFRPIDRFVHALVIVSFMLLVITGMPLKFYSEPWAHQFFDQIGGAAVAASLHRFAAVVTLTYFVLHIGSLMVLVRRHRARWVDAQGRFSLRRFLGLAFGPDSPFPRWQDVKDMAGHMKWFFARGPKPKFDRFTYWEKFDYMAVFWGVTVIGLSGLVMWYPAFFTRFLPGWSINIAHIVHSDEALLAAGFIFTFHFFNSHFRPEKFPYDQVMFSGHVTEEELKHERPAQYERMAEAGELEQHKVLGEWAQWKLIVNVFGAAAIVLGLTLAGAIFWAVLR